MVRAPRFMWEITHGLIPAGMLVCHTCDSPCCVNPEHLWIGTPKDNMRDMWEKGRGSKPPRSRPGMLNAKLSDVAAEIIRARYAGGGVTQQVLADEFGVDISLICRVINNERWSAAS